ncbi:hypothetical protein SAMN03159340_04086 [Sphingomonas sp. NFR15]|nr:hypothetical protein SAMN03159340_04086 [Sphingomonas sp. NFR15]
MVLFTGCLVPPAFANTSSTRSPRAVSGTRVLPPTSPTTVTPAVELRTRRTIACGWCALPARRPVTSRAMSCGVRPAAWTLPTKGTTIRPSLSTICSGNEVPRAVAPEEDNLGSAAMAPNKTAGGASQIAMSRTSPLPTADPIACPSPRVFKNPALRSDARSRRETLSLTSMTLILYPFFVSIEVLPTLRAEGPLAGAMAQPESAAARQATTTARENRCASFMIIQTIAGGEAWRVPGKSALWSMRRPRSRNPVRIAALFSGIAVAARHVYNLHSVRARFLRIPRQPHSPQAGRPKG